MLEHILYDPCYLPLDGGKGAFLKRVSFHYMYIRYFYKVLADLL